MTEQDIIKVLYKHIDERKFPIQVPNCFVYHWECDYWTLDFKGEAREYEIKISRSDFLNDAKKKKHKTEDGANFFYYVCPEGLIQPNEVASKYGLIYVATVGELYSLKYAKLPRRLHDRKFEDWQIIAHKMYWRWLSLWKDKRKMNEITRDEYLAGLSMDFFREEGKEVGF
jgi:hypothetical protein